MILFPVIFSVYAEEGEKTFRASATGTLVYDEDHPKEVALVLYVNDQMSMKLERDIFLQGISGVYRTKHVVAQPDEETGDLFLTLTDNDGETCLVSLEKAEVDHFNDLMLELIPADFDYDS